MDWSLDPVFGSFWVVVFVSLGLLMTLILVQETGRLTRKQSILLWTLRLGMCLVLLAFLLRPGLTFTKQSIPSGTIAVMVDDSASMLLPSGDSKQSRWDQQKEIIDSLWKARSKLGPNNQWATFAYSNGLRSLGTAKTEKDPSPRLPDAPEGATTDIGGPLGQLMGSSLDSPLSAVIWMGDGTQTLSPSGGDPLQMARRLTQLDIPMYVIAIGPRADSENSRDLSVEGVPEQLDAFTKNNLSVPGSLRCRGVANQELVVRLLMKQEGQPPRELSRAKIRPTRADQSIPFQLPLIAPESGAYELLVRAEPVEREAVSQNNESTVYLNVRSGGARILYIEGEPRMEMKFIRRAIDESADLKLEILPIYKPPTQNWPVDLSEKLAGDVYDCILLGDVDYAAIEQAGASKIADAVRRGAGLITLGGYHAYGPGGWGQSPLRDVLPIQMGNTSRVDNTGRINLQDHIRGPNPLKLIGSPEILQIDAPEKNAATWASLKPLQDINRWGGIKNSPGTVLLATNPSNAPMIVVGNADNGKVVSLAFDSTFLWARQGKNAEHKAFWRKLVLWAMRRQTVSEGMQIRMSQRRLFIPQPAETILEWNGGSNNVEMPANIAMHLWKMGGSDPFDESSSKDLGTIPLAKRDANSMRATFPGAKEPGRYEWRAQTTGNNGQVIEAKLPFIVVDRSIESMQPIPDWTLVEQMAKLNATAGGRLIAPDQTNDVIQQLMERRKQSTETIVENRKLGEGLIDSWVAFLALGTLMIAQWGLRKKWNLP